MIFIVFNKEVLSLQQQYYGGKFSKRDEPYEMIEKKTEASISLINLGVRAYFGKLNYSEIDSIELKKIITFAESKTKLNEMKEDYVTFFYKTVFKVDVDSVLIQIRRCENIVNENFFWLGENQRKEMLDYLKIQYRYFDEIPFTFNIDELNELNNLIQKEKMDIFRLRDSLFNNL